MTQNSTHCSSSVVVVLSHGGRGRAKIIATSSGKSRPLRDWPPLGPRSSIYGLPLFRPIRIATGTADLLWPPLWRILPRSLATVDCHVEHTKAATHRLAPAASSPIRFKDAVAIAQ